MRTFITSITDKKKQQFIGGVVLLVILLIGCRLLVGGNPPEEVRTAEYYVERWGGNIESHERILSSSDCAFLKEEFDWGWNVTEINEPGSSAHKWGLSYMMSSSDRADVLNCGWWE